MWRVPEELYISKGYWQPYTLGQELRRWSTSYGNRTALVSGKQHLSYEEVDTRADELAAGFFSLGIRPRDRVLVQLPNVAELVFACFALFRFGAIPVLTMPASRAADVDALCAHAKPVAYICPSRFHNMDYSGIAGGMKSKHAFLRHCISLDGEIEGSIPLADLYSKPKSDLPEPDFRETAVLLISGGTTGTPKLIPRRHTDYAYAARTCAERCHMDGDSVYLAVLPAAHNFPLCCPGILGTLGLGGKVVLSPTPSPDEAFQLIEREGVTHCALVPALLQLWLEAREWEVADLSSLKLIQAGGAPLAPDIAARVEPELGCRLQQVFGTAEGLICMTNPDDPLETLLRCQGKEICPDDELRFVDGSDNDVPEGAEGELLVRGPYTIQGYYCAPEVNRTAVTRDGYYRTGDMARRMPDGNIQVTGRVKDQINRAGEKIAPIEIENALRAHPEVLDTAVAGVPDPALGERICAWIISDKPELGLSDIRAFLQAQGMAAYKLPDEVQLIPTLPLTSVGKVDKRQLISALGA